jgi:PH (Pleckstrin Homology) domain-containing protein/putative oligomerization/nucleic acid binding protein
VVVTEDSKPISNVPELIRAFTNEEQDPAVVQSVFERVQQILTSGEKISYIAVQKRPLLNIAPDCVVLTNRRFIVYRPKLLGRVSFEDYSWRDLQDARLQENILGSTLAMGTTSGHSVSVDHLPKAQARRLYAFSQEMEERVREERRARELEDKRAGAGGVVVSAMPASAALPQGLATSDPVQRLKALKEMYEAGLITAGEYESKRAEIISKM